ncbi:CoA-binding protein [Paenibacillus chitinolyticus]|uniref:CoA-binding protein n=1 Tax=Paenibacillus chitinolyticus TaxID=79263 RepID=A0A410X0X0_9BACL|nr:CoA-binding protein [Paenibacillus chitinolyticus]MCY9588511.1 CoA-binding protein [Paenibacillus chitinolyticus]MCY9597881.1 CoA-binding protein [Paenibacillus chitinolyticus]QAV20260.1 CoA-binding protein [Paenibacillus chitinolyticus]
MPFENPSRDEIKTLLASAGPIAVVGLSDNPERVSHMVSAAMKSRGYEIIPVNPNADVILGGKSYASLSDIPGNVDIVNVFRRSDQVVPIAEEAVRKGAKVLWLQQGVYNEEAAEIAQRGGLKVVMDRCIKVEDAILNPRGN